MRAAQRKSKSVPARPARVQRRMDPTFDPYKDSPGIRRTFFIYQSGVEEEPFEFDYEREKYKSMGDLFKDLGKLTGMEDVVELCTPRGRRRDRITALQDMDTTICSDLVACGEDGFVHIDGGYMRLREEAGKKDESEDDSEDEDDTPYYSTTTASDYSRWKGGGQAARDRRANPEKSIFREDHTRSLMIYMFQNGKGYKPLRRTFNRSQLANGIEYIIEDVARVWNRGIAKICSLDGMRISGADKLINRGAYVAVFKDRPFFDKNTTWYLPDDAKNTA